MRLLNFILNALVQLESRGTCVACVGDSLCWHCCIKGFPKFVDWLEVQLSFEVTSWEANVWALAEDAELWAGWNFDAITVGVGLQDMALWQNLTQNMKLSTERKETEVKE